MRFAGMIPLGKGWPVVGSIGNLDAPSEEKSPLSCARVGTVQVLVAPWRSRLKSWPTKKNNLLLSELKWRGMKIGPPTFQPKLLNRSSGIVAALKARA